MEKKVAFIFPGQGAQYVGMGIDFFNQFDVARETFEEADELLNYSLSTLIFEGPKEELMLTKYSQVAIYVVSIAIWRTLSHLFPDITPHTCAGLSLGEYTALTASGRITFEDGIHLVQARGQYMHEASLSHPGTMAVVLGMEPKAIETVLHEMEMQGEVWIANLNCPDQVVISGTHKGIEMVSGALKSKGAKRVLPLDVSGAFHSGLMDEAKEKLKDKLASIPITSSPVHLIMNVSGELVSDEQIIRNLLIDQVVSPVYWEKSIRYMMEEKIDLILEIGCGKTLTGMNRKIGVTSRIANLDKVEDLEGIAEILDLMEMPISN